jgi:hypothetical protein
LPPTTPGRKRSNADHAAPPTGGPKEEPPETAGSVHAHHGCEALERHVREQASGVERPAARIRPRVHDATTLSRYATTGFAHKLHAGKPANSLSKRRTFIQPACGDSGCERGRRSGRKDVRADAAGDCCPRVFTPRTSRPNSHRISTINRCTVDLLPTPSGSCCQIHGHSRTRSELFLGLIALQGHRRHSLLSISSS